MSEQVLVFNANWLTPYRSWFRDGVLVTPGDLKTVLDDVLSPCATFYVDRDRAERDPGLKQVIPYVVLTRTAGGRTTYFAYRRGRKGGEARLHDRWSIGVGGHINPVDGDGGSASYWAAFRRELREEVSFDFDGEAPVRALLYDESDEVGLVHFGVVHFVEVGPEAQLRFNDPALADGVFKTASLLAADREKLEGWSRLVLDAVILAES